VVNDDIEGVENVNNNIEVLPLSPNGRSNPDGGLPCRVRPNSAQPLRHPGGSSDPYYLSSNGNVTLAGAVASEADKNNANIQARGVSGVFSVTNNLRVREVGITLQRRNNNNGGN